MKSTKTKAPMGSIKRQLSFFFCLFFVLSALAAQNGASNAIALDSEISRLERISASASNQDERYNAFLDLAGLYRLSGDSEAVLRAYQGALTILPDDGRALLEQGRFFISLGEYEKASAAINALLGGEREREQLIQGRYLAAMLEAFRSGNTRPLADLASDPDFIDYRSGIYYTLWKVTGLPAWKTRLSGEFSRSPEAGIAAGVFDSSPTPLWLLFPGRGNVELSEPATVPPPSIQAAAISPPQVPAPEADTSAVMLQTGLFSREEYARAMAERLTKAGFAPRVFRREVNGNNFWAVGVSAAGDINAAAGKLKDAGFDSFPIR